MEEELEEGGSGGVGSGVGRSLAGVSVLTSVIDPALSLLVVESLSVLYRAFCGDGGNGESESNALSLSPPCVKQQRGAFVPRPQSYKEKNQGRDMMHFGAYVHNNRLQDAQPMPFTSEIRMACAALVKAGAMPYDTWADACTVGMYEEGSWLPPHEDSRAFERPIVILSLLSDEQEMTFGQVDNLGEYREKARIRMPARSATIIDAPAAYAPWLHALAPAPTGRISLTFRRVSPEARRALQVERLETERAGAMQSLKCAAQLQERAASARGLSQNEIKKLRKKARAKQAKVQTKLNLANNLAMET